MKTTFKVSYYLRSNYENKEGKSPVMLRIYLGGEKANLGSTKIFVDKSKWSNKTSRMIGRTAEALSVNASIDALTTTLMQIYRKYETVNSTSKCKFTLYCRKSILVVSYNPIFFLVLC